MVKKLKRLWEMYIVEGGNLTHDILCAYIRFLGQILLKLVGYVNPNRVAGGIYDFLNFEKVHNALSQKIF
jgi:hypothetical protein